MTFFIHKHASGPAPQSGCERVGRYRNDGGEIWILWRTEMTPDEIRVQITGIVKIVGEDSDAEILALYPELLSQKRSRVRAEGATRLTNIAGEYCAEERETWTEQKEEAERYLADGVAEACPMLNAFATARGIDIGVLAQGIVDNATAFRGASGQVLGQTYALLDQVSGAPDLVTALAVDWS